MKKRGTVLFFLFFVQMLLVSCFSGNRSDGDSVLATPWETNKNNEQESETENSVSADAAFAAAEKYLIEMSLDEKVGQLFMVNLELLDSSKGSYHNFTKITKKMKQSIKNYPIGGVVLQSKNIETTGQLKKLINDLQKASEYTPLYIATEEAGGDRSIFAENTNLRCGILPGYAELGKTKTPEEVGELAVTMGRELKELGFNLNLAPIADIADEDKNAAYVSQCFSTDEDVTADMVAGMVTGLRQSGIAAVLRHFPGIGSVPGKIGQEFVNDNNGLTHMRDVDFIPFQAGISAGADMILVSNVAVTKITQNTVPACMSELIIGGIIRDELGFDGIVITDMMNVPVITSNYTSEKATLQALSAGADMILMPEDLEKSFKAVKLAVINQSLDMKVLNTAVLHILQNKIQRGIIPADSTE